MARVIYIGIFLDKASRDKLLENVQPHHENRFAHHCTLAFKPGMDLEGFFSNRLGWDEELEIIGSVTTENLDTVLVRLPDGLSAVCDVDFPHVTISTADGVSPVESNVAIEEANEAGTVEPSGGWLRGRIGFFMSDGREVFSMEEYVNGRMRG